MVVFPATIINFSAEMRKSVCSAEKVNMSLINLRQPHRFKINIFLFLSGEMRTHAYPPIRPEKSMTQGMLRKNTLLGSPAFKAKSVEQPFKEIPSSGRLRSMMLHVYRFTQPYGYRILAHTNTHHA